MDSAMEIERPIAPLPLRSLSITRNTFSLESVIVAMNEPWNFTKRCCFPQLLDDPFQRWTLGYIPVPNPPTSVFNDHKHVEGLKTSRRHYIIIHRPRHIHMVPGWNSQFEIHYSPFKTFPNHPSTLRKSTRATGTSLKSGIFFLNRYLSG